MHAVIVEQRSHMQMQQEDLPRAACAFRESSLARLSCAVWAFWVSSLHTVQSYAQNLLAFACHRDSQHVCCTPVMVAPAFRM